MLKKSLVVSVLVLFTIICNVSNVFGATTGNSILGENSYIGLKYSLGKMEVKSTILDGNQPVGLKQNEDQNSISLLYGYKFQNNVRTEFELGYKFGWEESIKRNVGAVFTDKTKINVFTGLVNVAYDFNTPVKSLKPYLGVSLGFGKVDVEFSRDILVPPHAGIYEAREIVFLYGLNAGVAYDINQSITLDIGYRLLASNEADIFLINKNNRYTLNPNVKTIINEFSLGVRYRF
jgi:opacity protein-like surface antigen